MASMGLRINSKEIHLMKPITGAEYDEKTVLTNSSWEFVDLWLRRQPKIRANRALFYWEQAKSFYEASELLPIESKPLTAYYCCMNAAKTLLQLKALVRLILMEIWLMAYHPIEGNGEVLLI